MHQITERLLKEIGEYNKCQKILLVAKTVPLGHRVLVDAEKVTLVNERLQKDLREYHYVRESDAGRRDAAPGIKSATVCRKGAVGA